jgi:hypothetical protein
MHVSIYVLALALGITNSRVATVMSRGGEEPTTLPGAMLGFVAMACTFGLLALGFFLYSWWVPIAAFVVIGLTLAFIVTRTTLAFFHLINPGLAVATIVLCGYGWWSWATL